MENEIVDKSIGERINNFRTWRGITQQGLADYLCKSKSVISNWEHGTTSPDVDSCVGICRLLNVTPNELLGWEKNKDYEKFIRDQKEYEKEIESLKHRALLLQKQIKDLEQKKDDKIPRPEIDDDLPFN